MTETNDLDQEVLRAVQGMLEFGHGVVMVIVTNHTITNILPAPSIRPGTTDMAVYALSGYITRQFKERRPR